MSWQVRNQYLDRQIGHHVVHLHDPNTGAEHVLQIIVGQESCPTCGHVKVSENVNEISPREIIAQEIAELEKAHAQAQSYARQHGIR